MVVIGYATGTVPEVDRWLDPWLVVFLNLPALVLIVLCYLWIGLNEAAAIAAVTLNKVPNVVTVVREGVRALNPELDAMSRVEVGRPDERTRAAGCRCPTALPGRAPLRTGPETW